MDNRKTPSVLISALLNPIRGALIQHPHSFWLLLASFSSAYLLRFWYLYIRVPKHLAHLPRLSITAFFLGSIRGNGFLKTTPQYTNLIIKDSISRKYSTDPSHMPNIWIKWEFGKWVVVIDNPKDIKIALAENKKFEKMKLPMHTPILRLIGQNVALAQTHDWARQRKVIYPAFRQGWSTPTFGVPARALIAQLDLLALNKVQVNVIEWMQRVTLDVLSSAVLGRNLDSCNNANADIVALYNDVASASRDPAVAVLRPIAFMFRSQWKNESNIARFRMFLDDIIDRKVKYFNQKPENNSESKKGSRDLMDLMVEGMLNEDVDFTRNDVGSNTMAFFIAGHDTTASTLSFSLYLMGTHQDVQDKARAEVLEVMGDVDSQVDAMQLPYLTDAQERKMHYMTCIIKESMRLYPPVTSVPARNTTDDHTFSDGTFIPKGSIVSINFWDVHRSKQIWGESADKFDPSRWETMQSGSDKTQSMLPNSHNYEWVPFGGGSRICMGQQFSIMEQRVILSMMLLRYKWTVVGNQAAMNGVPDSSSGLVLHPKNVYLELTRRT